MKLPPTINIEKGYFGIVDREPSSTETFFAFAMLGAVVIFACLAIPAGICYGIGRGLRRLWVIGR